MALLGITPVSPQRTQVRQESDNPSDFEKLMMGLQAAQSAFGIAADYTSIERNRAQTARTEQLTPLEAQRAQQQITAGQSQQRETDIMAAGGQTPKALGSRKLARIPENFQVVNPETKEPIEIGFTTTLNTIGADGQETIEEVRVIDENTLKILAQTPDDKKFAVINALADKPLSEAAKSQSQAQKAETDQKLAKDKFDQRMKTDEFVRDLNSEDRNRIAKATGALIALKDYEEAVLDGAAAKTSLGMNTAMSSAAIFQEAFGRLQSGGAITEETGFWADFKSFLGMKTGGEIGRFATFLPQPEDTPEAARTKIDKMRKFLEGQAITISGRNRNDVNAYLGRVDREVNPTKQLRFETPSEVSAAAQRATEQTVGPAIGGGSIGVGKGFVEPLLPQDQGPPPEDREQIRQDIEDEFSRRGTGQLNNRQIDKLINQGQGPGILEFLKTLGSGGLGGPTSRSPSRNSGRAQKQGTPAGKTVIPKR